MSAWDNQPGEMIPCACGCGGQIRNPDVRGRERKWMCGHNRGQHRPNVKATATPCECGCGELCNGRFVWGHNFAGRTHSAATRAVLSRKATRPKPEIRGARNGMYGRTGSLNPRYVDGSSPERQRVYAGAAWRALRREVFKRDGRACSRCGSSESPHLHHIKPWAGHPELRLDPANIVVLCRDCHHAEHRKGVLL